jgi:hypothetical protein
MSFPLDRQHHRRDSLRRSTRSRYVRLQVEALERRELLALFLDPVVSGSVLDQPRDGIGDVVQSAPLVRQIGDEESRAIVEFDLSGITLPVDLAVIDFSLYDRIQGTPVRTFDLIGYAGNGHADLSDFSAPGTLLHTVAFWGEQAGAAYQLDVTAEVNVLLAAGATHFGLRADAVGEVIQGGLDGLRLSIDGLPPPRGRRDWETIPNAIRADGVESFRVEVNLYGEVRSASIEEGWNVYLVGSGPNPYELRDDGTGGDRVAGDFIYTSGEFRFNTSFPFPYEFFRGNKDSPPGVGISIVGPLVITELDGSQSRALVAPEIAILDPSIPLVATEQISPEIVISDHVINVQTRAMATQRSMRGPQIVLDQLTRPIYEQLPDVFDFLMLFSTNKVEHEPFTHSANFRTGVHDSIQNDFTGSRQALFDRSADFGSGGKLKGINMLDALGRGMYDANAVHELVHQWSAYVAPSLGMADLTHYFNNSSVGSLVGGFEWLDNGDGSFTINFDEGRNGASQASPLDLYFMGLIESAEVPPIRLFDTSVTPTKSPDNPVVLPDEIVRTVTIDDIIAAHGTRVPGPGTAQRDFRLGFVAESHNRALTPTEMTFYEIFAANFAKPIPEEEPPPMLDFGWAPMTKFFGHGPTWVTVLPGRQSTNQSPVIADAVFEIPETAAGGTTVGFVPASDPDAGQTLTYIIAGGNEDAAFTIDSETGLLRISPFANRLSNSQYTLRIRVMDDGIPSLWDSATVLIRVTDVNQPPVITGQTWTVVENSSAGTVVGTAQASDPDAGQSLTFRIVSGNDGGAFAIDPFTGVVTVNNVAAVDYELRQSFHLTIEAADSGDPSLATTASFTINVTDVADIIIDVKPGDSTNTISVRFDTKLPVAILSTESFNATTQVDVNSLTFGKTGTENSLVRHRKTGQPQVEYGDVNGDGLLDLIAYFDVKKTGLLVGDSEAFLGGRLTVGTSFKIASAVRVVSSKR